MVNLFGEFHYYLTPDEEEDITVFNNEKFILNKKSNKNFFTELVESQNFNYFVQQDCKENFPYFYKLCAEEDKQLIAKFGEILEDKDINKKANYIIKPYFMDENMTDFNSIEEFLFEKYSSSLESNNFINEGSRVIQSLHDINSSNTTGLVYYRYFIVDNSIRGSAPSLPKSSLLSTLQLFESKLKENESQIKTSKIVNTNKSVTFKHDTFNAIPSSLASKPLVGSSTILSSTTASIPENNIDEQIEKMQKRGEIII